MTGNPLAGILGLMGCVPMRRPVMQWRYIVGRPTFITSLNCHARSALDHPDFHNIESGTRGHSGWDYIDSLADLSTYP